METFNSFTTENKQTRIFLFSSTDDWFGYEN